MIDDGTHSVFCDICNVWQHTSCVGLSQEDAERDCFRFFCKRCRRREQDAKRANSNRPTKSKSHVIEVNEC